MSKVVHAHSSYAGVATQDGQHAVQAAGVRDAAGRRREDQPTRVPGGRLPLLPRDGAFALLLGSVLRECPHTVLRERHRANGSHGFGGTEDQLTPDALHVPADSELTVREVDVRPCEGERLTPPQARGHEQQPQGVKA